MYILLHTLWNQRWSWLHNLFWKLSPKKQLVKSEGAEGGAGEEKRFTSRWWPDKTVPHSLQGKVNVSFSISSSLPPLLSQLRSVWLTAGPDCIRLNHKLLTHPPYLHPPHPTPYLTLSPFHPLPISISLSLYSPIFHSPCISPAPPLLFLPSSNHYFLFFTPFISLTLPVLYNTNAVLLEGCYADFWTVRHVSECLLEPLLQIGICSLWSSIFYQISDEFNLI